MTSRGISAPAVPQSLVSLAENTQREAAAREGRTKSGGLAFLSLCLILWLGHSLAPDSLKALVVLILAGLGLLPLLVYALQVERRAAFLAVACLPLLLSIAISTILAPAPRVSFIGMVSQHSGAFFLALLPAAFAGGIVFLKDRRLQLWLLGLFSLLGSLSALAYWLDTLGALPQSVRYAPVASGLFENPASQAQFLLLCAMATGVLLVRFRSSPGKVLALAVSAILVGYALVSTALLASFVALGVAAAAFVAMTLFPQRRARVVSAAVFLPLFSPVLLATFFTAEWLRSLANYRFDLWDAALHRVAARPALGWGPDAYTALFGVDLEAGSLSYSQSTDPHNLILLLTVSLGLGGVLALAATGLALSRVVAADVDGCCERYLEPRIMVSLLCTLPVFWAFSWPNPLAALLFGLALGSLAFRLRSSLRVSRFVRYASLFVAIGLVWVGLLFLLLALPAGKAEYSLSRQDVAPAELRAQYESSGDPSFYAQYASVMLEQYRSGLVDAEAFLQFRSQLAETAREDGQWFALLPLFTGFADAAEVPEVGPLPTEPYEAALQAGRSADANTPAWTVFELERASRVGAADQAATAAQELLDRPHLPPGIRAYAQSVLNAGGNQ